MEIVIFSFGHPRHLFSFAFGEVHFLNRQHIATTNVWNLFGNKRLSVIYKNKNQRTKVLRVINLGQFPYWALGILTGREENLNVLWQRAACGGWGRDCQRSLHLAWFRNISSSLSKQICPYSYHYLLLGIGIGRYRGKVCEIAIQKKGSLTRRYKWKEQIGNTWETGAAIYR